MKYTFIVHYVTAFGDF